MTPEITPFIWYDADPREVRDFYASIFKDLVTVYEMTVSDGPPVGVAVAIAGKPYVLFNGGPAHPQTNAFSLAVSADGQDEVDYFWEKLVEGGGAH